MVLSIDGHGRLMTRYPPSFVATDFPSRDITSASMPGKGSVAEPGLVGIAPGIGVIMIEPVSVCHQVSTIGHRSLPITLWYQIQASGLIGSPTDPSSRSDERSYFSGHCSPHLMKVRIAVGAVYRILTRWRSMIDQKRPKSGVFGAPSYIKAVAPFCSGP